MPTARGSTLHLDTARRSQTFNKSVVKVYGLGQRVEFVLDDSAPFQAVEKGLREYLERTEGRFEGGTVSLNLGQRVLNREETRRILALLQDEFHLQVAGLWCSPSMLEGLVTGETPTIPRQLPLPDTPPLDSPTPDPDTLLVRKTLRSGETVHYKGDVVILGDVNPGAEVSASRDIIVFGRLRGLAHAGANGDDSAVIIALTFEPIQVRIGDYIGIGASNGKGRGALRPHIAFVEEGAIVIEPYTSKFRWL